MPTNNKFFIDPSTFNPTNLFLTVLVDDLRGGIGWVIKDDTSGNYCHAMNIRKIGFLVSQNLWFHEIPIETYLIPSNMLKFWQVNNLTAEEYATINAAIDADLKSSAWDRFYNFLGIVGQAVKLPWISMPDQDICSQRCAKYLRLIPRLAIAIDEHPSPSSLDTIFNAHPELFTCIGFWWSD